jgi:hypothetical protein
MANTKFEEDMIFKTIRSYYHQNGNTDTEGILDTLQKTGLIIEPQSLQKRIDEIKKHYPKEFSEEAKESLHSKKGD